MTREPEYQDRKKTMETLKKTTAGEEGANPPPQRATRRWNGHEEILNPSEELWSTEILAGLGRTSAPRASLRKRKRRLYADYRELLALESKARKLNFLGPESARSLTADPQVLPAQERALHFGKTARPTGPLPKTP